MTGQRQAADKRAPPGPPFHQSGQTSSVSARCLIPRSILRSIGSPAASLIIWRHSRSNRVPG
jgi:hypothetical protein